MITHVVNTDFSETRKEWPISHVLGKADITVLLWHTSNTTQAVSWRGKVRGALSPLVHLISGLQGRLT